ncbi:MAG: hypothetical protein U9R42_14345 [Bacteroidota bacterium]|nr:hypothetical protein [Bacteroidota bacterium]
MYLLKDFKGKIRRIHLLSEPYRSTNKLITSPAHNFQLFLRLFSKNLIAVNFQTIKGWLVQIFKVQTLMKSSNYFKTILIIIGFIVIGITMHCSKDDL